MNKILVVEDQYRIRTLLKEIMENEGYEVLEADNGNSAIELLQSEHIDLLLLDMKIPEKDGIEVLIERKERNLATQAVVILITAYEEVGVIEEARKLGAISYILKPFDIDLLKEEINKYL